MRSIQKALVIGCIAGVVCAFVARLILAHRQDVSSPSRPVSGLTTGGVQPLFADWKTSKSPLPPPFSKLASQRVDRTSLPKEARARIVVSSHELLTSRDYLEVLESLAKDEPEYLFQTALNAGPLTSVVAMRCCLSHTKDFNLVAAKLKDLQQDEKWKSRLGSLIDEVWLKPEARSNDTFWKVLGEAGLNDDDIRNKTGMLLRTKAGEDLNGAITLIGGHPELREHAREIYQEWGKQEPQAAAEWIKSTIAEHNTVNSLEDVRHVAAGLFQAGGHAVIQEALDSIKTIPEGPATDKLLSSLMRNAVAVGEPSTWIPYVRDLRPGHQKNLIALDLGIRLDQSGGGPPNWGQWFSDMGVDNPENWAEAIALARKRRSHEP